MPVDPESMPTRNVGEAIMTDRPCTRCGYNLRGLDTSGVCPECGAAIVVRKKSVRFADTLIDAPMWYLKLIAGGMGLMAAVVVVAVGLWLASWIGGRLPAGGLAALANACVWFGAVWMVTTPRPHGERTVKDPILDHARLRLAARVCQGLWAGSAGLIALGAATGAVVFDVLGGVLTLGALFGLVPLGVYLSSLADWSGDTGVGSRLRASVWCIAVCGSLLLVVALLLLVSFPFRLLLAVAMVGLSLIVMVGFVLFGVSVIQMSLGALWAIQNSHEAREREIRMAERKRREAEKAWKRADAAASAQAAKSPREEDQSTGEAIPLTGAEEWEPALPSRSGTGTEEKNAKAVDPYELAPEEE